MKRLLCLVILGASLAASAQTTTIQPQLSFRRVDDPNVDSYTFGAGQCNDTITVRWLNTLLINLTQCTQNPLKVWATNGECGDAPATGDKRYDDIPGISVQNIRQGTFTVKLSELPGFTTAATDGGSNACGAGESSTTHRICGSIEYAILGGGFGGCGTATKQTAVPLKLIYDTLPPGPPTLVSAAAQDEGVRVDFEYDGDTTIVMVEARGPGEADFRQLAETTASNKLIRGKGLQNNVEYEVRLRAKDAAGNVSGPSGSVNVTPIKTLGFWAYYKQQGGTDEGGCSTGAGLAPMLIGLWALRRARQQARSKS
jgi:hypothetical protein